VGGKEIGGSKKKKKSRLLKRAKKKGTKRKRRKTYRKRGGKTLKLKQGKETDMDWGGGFTTPLDGGRELKAFLIWRRNANSPAKAAGTE